MQLGNKEIVEIWNTLPLTPYTFIPPYFLLPLLKNKNYESRNN